VVSGENYTRVSIELTGETEYTHTILSEDREADKPKRIVLDIKNSKISSNLKEPIPVKDEHLLQIRSSQFDKDTVRVVLDLKSIEEYSTFYFQSPFRIIVDVTGSNYKQTAMDLLLEELGKVENVSEEGSEEIPSVRSEPQEVSEKFHIFIDPGHGGEDPGAIGKHLKLKEKDVTLEVALELKKLFEERGFKVSMSRDKDVFIPLQERTAMANSANADLFISIHANASRRRGAHGIETYFFDLSNDQDVLKLAAMENGIPIQQLNTLQFILTDMERTPIRNQSAMLASSIQENMCTALNTSGVDARNIGVKHGPFYVLKGAKMPAVLVEIAFITNPREERLLASTKYRKKIAQGIMSGVSKYIDNMKTNPIAFLP
jgi:N-acetylmuramoyl-L-alanine amidase